MKNSMDKSLEWTQVLCRKNSTPGKNKQELKFKLTVKKSTKINKNSLKEASLKESSRILSPEKKRN